MRPVATANPDRPISSVVHSGAAVAVGGGTRSWASVPRQPQPGDIVQSLECGVQTGSAIASAATGGGVGVAKSTTSKPEGNGGRMTVLGKRNGEEDAGHGREAGGGLASGGRDASAGAVDATP